MTRIFLPCILLLQLSCQSPKPDPEIIFQASTFDRLMAGQFDGTTTFDRLKTFGDFGLGTFHKLDGEMIGLDGQFFQVRADGQAYPVDLAMKTPFATVTDFQEDQRESLTQALNYQQLQAYLNDLLPEENHFYAIKIEGLFKTLQTRSVHAQEKPYPTLTEAIDRQVVFDHEKIRGTMIGFRMPESIQGASTAGFHFHFISADKSRGGHVLDLQIGDVQISIDYSEGLQVVSPEQ